MPDKILITEITVNGRVLRAEPPIEVEVEEIVAGSLYAAYAVNMPGMISGSTREQTIEMLRERIAEHYTQAMERADRYRQRFKEAE